MVAKLALDVILASFLHCRLTIELLSISEPTEKFNALILDHVEKPWPYMVTTHPWPDDLFHLLDDRGTCVLHIFLTTNGSIWQAAPGFHWWAADIMHVTYYLTIRVVQADISLPTWNSELRAEAFTSTPRALEHWALMDVILGSNDDYIVQEISAMYLYCSREEVICLKILPLSTPHDQLFRQMFPLAWPAGSFDYNQWRMHYLSPDEWLHKGGSKVEKILNPPPFRLLKPKDPHTGHVFENRLLTDILLHFNASLSYSWDPPKEYLPLTFIKIDNVFVSPGKNFVFYGIGQVGFVYCINKASPHHYIYSIASPLDWPTWACAAGAYVIMCVIVRMISGQWQLLNIFISFLAQGATLCLQRLRAVWLLWIITAIFIGWFFNSSIEALLVSPTLPTGINDMEGLFHNGYRLVMDEWSFEGITATWKSMFMSETAYLRALKANIVFSHNNMLYGEHFLKSGLNQPQRALVLPPEQAKVLLVELQQQFDGKQCFGNPHALSTYTRGLYTAIVNDRMVADVVIRLRAGGLGVWYEKNAAVSSVYEWTQRFLRSLKAIYPDEVSESGPISEWKTRDTPLEGFHRTTDRNELRALFAISSTALAIACAMFVMEVNRSKILVLSVQLSTWLKSVLRFARGLLIWVECVVWGYVKMAAHRVVRFVRYYCED